MGYPGPDHAASVLAFSQSFNTGPIASATGGADLRVLTGIIVAGVVHFLLAGRAVRAEGLRRVA